MDDDSKIIYMQKFITDEEWAKIELIKATIVYEIAKVLYEEGYIKFNETKPMDRDGCKLLQATLEIRDRRKDP